MIKDQWAPTIQRERDESIMERFCELTKSKRVGATARGPRIANEVRIWLRAITIADLANVGGTCIPYDRLDESWRNCSTLHWPDQPHPSKKMFGVFWWFLRKPFCPKPQRQHRTINMPLNEHLGKWIPCQRHSVYECTRTSEWLYKTTVDNSYPTAIRLGCHISRRMLLWRRANATSQITPTLAS